MTSWKARFVAAFGALALHASSAVAQTGPAVPESAPDPDAPSSIGAAPSPPAPPEVRWYGWQTLVADGGAVALFGLAAGFAGGNGNATTVAAAGLIGLGAYLAGGPIIHAAHGHPGKAGVSLALRVGLPVLAWAVGFGLGSNSCHDSYDHEGCPTDYAAAATLVGVLTSVALDAGLLGRERVAEPTRNAPIVFFTPGRGGGGLSFARQF
jgi:hypothetical protein